MNIVAIVTARNEQDVIEAFVRHTSTLCSALLVVDHGSTDDTPDILKELQEEGLPLRVIRDETVGLLQTRHMNLMLQTAANELQADWVLCLDADEFVQGDLPAVLADQAARFPGSYIKYPLLNYYVRESDDSQELNPVKRMVYRSTEEEGGKRVSWHYKSLVSGDMARQKGAFLGTGNHHFTINGVEPPSEFRADIWIGHFSLRQPAQYAGKIVSNLFQKNALRAEGIGGADHYAQDLRRIRESYTAYQENFCNVSIPWWGDQSASLIHDPLDYRGGELRYTPRVDDVDLFIRNTLHSGESITRTLAKQAEGATLESKQEGTEVVFSLEQGGVGEEAHVKTFRSGLESFTNVRFPLNVSPASHLWRLDFTLQGGRGMLEIEVIELHFPDGEQRVISPPESRGLLSCSEGGLLAPGGAHMQVFVDFVPAVLTLSGVVGMGEKKPEFVVFRVRFVDDYRMVALALCDVGTMYRLQQEMKERAQEALPIPGCPFDEEIVFRPSGNGAPLVREGWKALSYSGLWLNAKQGRLRFCLPEPTTSAFLLKLEVRCKMPQGGHGEGAQVHMLVDGKELATHPLGQKYQKQCEIAIPAEPNGRREIDVIFSLETTDPEQHVGFAIKAACLMPLARKERLLLRCRRWVEQLAEALERRDVRNGVALGEEISFARGGRGVWMASSGWGPAGSWGTPVEGGASLLKFRVKEGSDDLRVRFELWAPYLHPGVDLPLKLAVAELDVASWTVEGTAPRWLEARLPAKALSRGREKREGKEGKEITLMLKAPCMQGELELARMIVERVGA